MRSINRLNDTIHGYRLTGSMKVAGEEIYDPGLPVEDLRRRVGMLFQRAAPLPLSINLGIALHVLLAGLSTFVWGMRRGLQPVAAVVAGALFMFSGAYFLHVYSGNTTVLSAMAWMPLVLASVAADTGFEALSISLNTGKPMRAMIRIFTTT